VPKPLPKIEKRCQSSPAVSMGSLRLVAIAPTSPGAKRATVRSVPRNNARPATSVSPATEASAARATRRPGSIAATLTNPAATATSAPRDCASRTAARQAIAASAAKPASSACRSTITAKRRAAGISDGPDFLHSDAPRKIAIGRMMAM
jgi:hypothetical protein